MQARALPLLVLLAGAASAQLDDTFQWTIEGTPWTELGRSSDGAGDVNGDGKADVIVGIPVYGYSTASGHVGAAWVFYGGSSASPVGGLDPTTPDWTCTGEPGGSFGQVVRGVGDLNNDGFDDVAVGAPAYAAASMTHGAVYVFYGSPTGLSGGPAATYADADWRAEGVLTDGSFGVSIVGPGDLNGDGFDDILIAATRHDSDPSENEEGIVYAWLGEPDLPSGGSGLAGGFSGTPSNARFWVESDVFDAELGQVMTEAGDLDGDTVPDFAVRASHGPGDVSGSGRVYFVAGGDYTGKQFLDGPGGIAIDSAGGLPSTGFGEALVGGFDLDDDGYSEVAVGVPNGLSLASGTTFAGDVRIYEFDSFLLPGMKVVNWHPPHDPYARFGSSLAAGDFDFDGFTDLAVGEPLALDDASGDRVGAVHVYTGQPSGGDLSPFPLGLYPAWTALGTEKDARFGDVLACSGDVHGDLADDLLVSTRWHDTGPGSYSGQAFLFGGDAPVVDSPCVIPVPQWTFDGNPVDPILDVGHSVAGVGDIDGDGYEEVLVGAYRAHYDGRAYLFRGGPDGLGDQPVWTGYPILVPSVAAGYGYAVAGAGDVNADGFPDVIIGAPGGLVPELVGPGFYSGGRAYVYHGGPAGLSPVPDWTGRDDKVEPSLFGCSVDGLGDVSLDGIADVAVGARGFSNLDWDMYGRVYVWHGSASGLNLGVEGTPFNYDWAAQPSPSLDPGTWFGASITGTGDLDPSAGTGSGGIAIGAPFAGDTNQGIVLAWKGPLATPWPLIEETYGLLYYHWSEGGDTAAEQFGTSLDGGSDWNGDGLPDLVVGAPGHGFPGDGFGRAVVYFGNGDKYADTPGAVFKQPHPTRGLGVSVAFIDDFDGSGKIEVAAAAAATSSPEGGEGRIFLFEDGEPDPIFVTESDAPEAGLGGTGWGNAVAGVDANGDGLTDLLAGANRFLVDGENVGRAYLWPGGPIAYLNVAPSTLSPGDMVTISYTGGLPGTTVFIGLASADGTPGALLFGGPIGLDGCFVREIVLPPTTPLGTYYLIAGTVAPGTGFVFSNLVEVIVN